MSSKKLDSAISIAQSHPNILVISSDKELVNQLKEYIEDYDYNFIGSADTKQTIKNNLINSIESCCPLQNKSYLMVNLCLKCIGE